MNIYGGAHLTLRDKLRVWYFAPSITMLCSMGENIAVDAVIVANLAVAAWQLRKADVDAMGKEEEEL